ncbi:glycine cleavage system T protein [Ketogulonicigenium robustum]|uniref:aminomethyltransferase n=1 Tax=Ketogulonicigenium robustum TaxID=92947 RepID=A0A1W6NZK8_9RHOB|nr:glycine cleavage system aminomethyltransferase GcvT [Ketogulonicigenium robustum]ARO14685.1 glycine cleavage system T protein [Ketogulonicigenium robustum]
MAELMTNALQQLPLAALHHELGAKMCPFAGYEMPINYPAGVMKEHIHTRTHAGLFDVSHMGQVLLQPKGDMETLALAFERLMPVDVLAVKPGRQRYGLLTNEDGGILDDLMFANRDDHYYVVVNAACKTADLAHLRAHLSDVADVIEVTDRALLALQGPDAEAVLEAIVPGTAAMRFMDVGVFGDLWISRSGYTGEDGFEISVPLDQVTAFAHSLLADTRVQPIGLGARDSLRLEAGLCLYGHDIDTTTSPVEANLTWAIQKARRTGGAREGGFAGADRILREMRDGPSRLRAGLLPDGRAPLREGVELIENEQVIGRITSGGFGPTLERPVAMGYVPTAKATVGTELTASLRGRAQGVSVADMPFFPNRYKR